MVPFFQRWIRFRQPASWLSARSRIFCIPPRRIHLCGISSPLDLSTLLISFLHHRPSETSGVAREQLRDFVALEEFFEDFLSTPVVIPGLVSGAYMVGPNGIRAASKVNSILDRKNNSSRGVSISTVAFFTRAAPAGRERLSPAASGAGSETCVGGLANNLGQDSAPHATCRAI